MTPSAWVSLVLAVSNVLVGVMIGWNLAEAKRYRDELLRIERETQAIMLANQRLRKYLEDRAK